MPGRCAGHAGPGAPGRRERARRHRTGPRGARTTGRSATHAPTPPLPGVGSGRIWEGVRGAGVNTPDRVPPAARRVPAALRALTASAPLGAQPARPARPRDGREPARRGGITGGIGRPARPARPPRRARPARCAESPAGPSRVAAGLTRAAASAGARAATLLRRLTAAVATVAVGVSTCVGAVTGGMIAVPGAVVTAVGRRPGRQGRGGGRGDEERERWRWRRAWQGAGHSRRRCRERTGHLAAFPWSRSSPPLAAMRMPRRTSPCLGGFARELSTRRRKAVGRPVGRPAVVGGWGDARSRSASGGGDRGGRAPRGGGAAPRHPGTGRMGRRARTRRDLDPDGRHRRPPAEVPADRDIVVVCRSGARSARVTAALRGAGYEART